MKKLYHAVEDAVSATFRDSFESHPNRDDDPGLALDSAQEAASRLVPDGVYGEYDAVTLTFRVDMDALPQGGGAECVAPQGGREES
jgi:hypothetical protein